MKANILRDAMGNITVQMSGDFTFDNCIPLRSELKTLAAGNPHAKITVDLGAVDFVGSSGISHFVETIHLINQKKAEHNKVLLSNVSNDFQKVFKLFTSEEIDLIWNEFDKDGDETQELNQKFGNRKRTFQN